MKQLLATIVAMPNIDFTFIMLADSPILPLWMTDIISFVMISAVFLFYTLLAWSCWLAIKVAALFIKKYLIESDINSFKITKIDFWIFWLAPVLLWCSIIFLKPDLIGLWPATEDSWDYHSKRNNLITLPTAPALIWSVVGCFFGTWRLWGMKTIGKILAVILTAGIFYLGTYVFGSVPLGSSLFYALAIILVGLLVGLIFLSKKLK